MQFWTSEDRSKESPIEGGSVADCRWGLNCLIPRYQLSVPFLGNFLQYFHTLKVTIWSISFFSLWECCQWENIGPGVAAVQSFPIVGGTCHPTGGRQAFFFPPRVLWTESGFASPQSIPALNLDPSNFSPQTCGDTVQNTLLHPAPNLLAS